MITDRDILKLSEVFLTKDDVKGFATKDDLKAFATKDDLKGFATKDDLHVHTTLILQRIDSQSERIDSLEERMDETNSLVSRIAGDYDALRLEEAAGGQVMARHTRQLEALSTGTGVPLPE